eukprot:CAMPEP_0168170436 /NCGR_PEP_ID=MMETSP0139_2-20121125/4179_1 /TAXON_ID=44445 /ORGANISM="Pseudo-nitzschia australis, Strain 10249 10 AB" /LENGTH=73 /DNA_ID=CAMNT_0008087939 /DNA_START=103 /DNA_END=324 /DNA_ORIENTATION=+
MNQQSNSIEYAYDVTGRLSAADKEMMAQVSMTNSTRIIGVSEETLTKKRSGSLSTSPQEEKMKNIYMPKRIGV